MGGHVPRTVTQTSSAFAETPDGRWGMAMRVTRFVFGSIRQTARSRGVVAQMPPAPAATFHVPARPTTGKEMLRGVLDLTARRRTTRGCDQSEAQRVSPSIAEEPQLP
jgi:hypothetical protein